MAQTRSPRAVRWGLGDFFWVFFGGLAAALLVGLVDIGIRHPDVANGVKIKTDAIDDLVGAVGQFGTMFALLAILIAVKGAGMGHDLGLRVHLKDWYWCLIGMACGIGANLLVTPLVRVWEQHHNAKQAIGEALQESHALPRMLLIVLIVVVAPLVEESTFRGLLLRASMRRVEAVYAVLISGTVFGLAHALDPNVIPALPALVLFGTILAVVAVRSGSLSRSILMHVGFNTLGVIGLLAAK